MKKLIGLVVVLILLLIISAQPNIKRQDEYTIVYFTKENTEKIPTMTVKKNGKAFRPKDPQLEDAEFGGWYLSYTPTDDDEEFDFENTKITESITLFARWIFEMFTVDYDLNGGYWPDEPFVSSFSASDKRIFIKPSSSATHPKHDSYGRFSGWRTIPQSEFLELTAEEQKKYPEVTSFTPNDPSTLKDFDENKHLNLYAYYKNFKGE